MNRDQIARAAHEINRAYCASIGDDSQPTWEDAPDWQKASALAGVDMHLANPEATPEQSHESWLAQKKAEGWKFGKVKDPEKKEHPCMRVYAQLPASQRAKDYLFRAVVHLLKDAPGAEDTANAVRQQLEAQFEAMQAANIKAVPPAGKHLPVRYIGRRASHKDSLYGTGIWTKDQTRLVPDTVAAKMFAHPDVYAPSDAVPGAETAVVTPPAREDDKDPTQAVRDSISIMEKPALASFAKIHFNAELDQRHNTQDLRTQVTRLVDQFGVA